MNKLKGVWSFKATCRSCKNDFGYPLLGMMSEGEFIAQGEKGTVYAYLVAFIPEWEEISGIIKRIPAAMVNERDTSDRLQWVIGRCMDRLEGQRLTIWNGPICPNCQSRDVAYGDAEKIKFLSLSYVTWEDFNRRTVKEKHALVNELWGQSEEMVKTQAP